MNDHYFSEQPNAASRPKTWETELKGYSLQMTSDEGVFSKRGVDLGTKLLVQAFEMHDLQGPLLDIGCGYGPIGLALAKTNPSREVFMIDINERAIDLAKENAVRNRIHNVQIFQSDLFEQVPAVDFSVILSNPPIRAGKRIVYRLFEKSCDHLAKGGEFWTVIRKQQGAPSAVKKLREIYHEVSVIQKKKGFFIIKCTK